MSELYNYYDYYNPDINECLVYLRGFNNSEQYQESIYKIIDYINELENIIFGYTE